MTTSTSFFPRATTSLVSFLLVLAGLAFLPAAPAAAAQPAFACDTIYSVMAASPHTISKINAVTGAVSSNGAFAQGSGDNVNALALGAGGGRYVYGFNRQANAVLRYDATTETVASVTAPANSLAPNVVAGAINPATGIYYYAASASGTWTVFAFNTATSTSIGQVATITSTALSTNGDMAFDALGNLYLTTNASTTAAGSLARVTGTVPTTAGSTTLGATTLTATPADSGQYTSIAIDDTGLLVIGTSTGKVLRVNAATGATVSTNTVALSLADLASCSVPSTGTVRANLPQGRYRSTDQFNVTITGGGVTSGNSGTTTGTDSGLQDSAAEVGGAVITMRNTTYTVTQTAAGTTNLADYTTTWSCVRQSDNSVLSSGTGNTGTYTAPTTAADVICTFTDVPLIPSISLTKTAGPVVDANGNGKQDAGDTVVYSYAVTNNGDVALSSVGVVDAKAGTVTCPQTTLAVGASMTCTSKTYTLTQADVDAGTVVAPATATGTSPTNNVVTDTRSTTTPITRVPTISVVQTPSAISDTNGNGKQDAGDSVTYGHVVTNTGNVTLTGVTVTDPVLGTITCPQATLAPHESVTCTPKATTLTQAQVNAGKIDTVATATGTPPAGANVSASSPNSVPITRTPAIDLTLTGSALADTNANGKVDPGDTITYAFTVKNTGTVTLDPATVNDPFLGGPITCPTGALAPGATITCTSKSYAVTQADIDAGSVVNTATATGVPPAGANVTDTETVTTTLAQSPSVTVLKTASAIADTNSSGKQDAGDKITYAFKVTNTGNVTVASVGVVDAKVGTVTCTPTALAPDVSVTCTAPAYTLTQADVDAGKVVNTATASATSPQGVKVTATDTVTTTITQQPAVKLVKTAGAIADVNASGKQDAGDTITYSFVVTNTGTTTLSNVTTTDTLLGAITCPSGNLAPGASVTCTNKTYVLTQANVNAGSVGSPATVTATSPAGVQVTDTSSTTTPITAAPSIAVTKSASPIADTNGDGQQSAGDKITYTFTVTNTGNVTLDPVSLADTTVGAVTCAATVVQPGQTVTCTTKDHTLTQADVNAGSVFGTVTASGKPPVGASVTATAATATPITATPKVQLTKTASAIADTNADGKQDVGDTITYSFTVKNTGNVPLNPVSVTDQTVGAVTCPSGALAPGATITCTDKAYVLTQADVDAAVVTGAATATGKPPAGANVTDTRSTTTPVAQIPSVTIKKSASAIADTNGNDKPDAGDRITYSFVVTNNGTVTLSGATVSDPKVGAVTCPTAPLAPGASMSCTAAPYAITQADVNAGKVVNTATVEATSPGGTKVTANDTVTTPIAAGPVITIDQTVTAIRDANGNGRTDAGDTVTYGYVVTNLGNVTLTGAGVNDPRFGAITCPQATLTPNESMTCTPRTYPLTQADVDAGTLPGRATATGTAPGGATVSDTDSVTTAIPAAPAVLLTKTASPIADSNVDGKQSAGDRITYSFTVKNTGNVTLDPVTVTDTLLGTITCPTGALAPGATATCTDKAYVLTQADVDAGSVSSPATATGKPPVGANATDTRATTTPIVSTPSVQLTKTAGPIQDLDANGPDAGDKITYAFTVKNTGNTTLTAVVLTDTLLGTVACPTTIAPGATVTCTSKDYTLTQADVDAGSVSSPATVTGKAPDGTTVSDTRATTTPIASSPRIEMDKTASPVDDLDGNGTDAGDTITYGFVVTNTGNTTLDPVTVTDTTVGAVTCPTGALAPGATVTCTPKTYVLTQADVDAGSVTGTATATGTAPGGAQVTASDSTATPLTGAGAIQLTKTAGPIQDLDANGPDAGDKITYAFTVKNTGNTTLTTVVLTDPLLGTVTCPTTIAPGATVTCTSKDYTLTQADVDAGTVGSPATVTARTPSGASVTDTRATATPIAAAPRIRLDLTAGPVVDVDGNGPDAGDTITYSYVVTNTGNVTLDPTAVSDPLAGPVTCSAGPLAPGASRTCTTTTYAVTQADVEAGSVNSTATATGTAPGGTKVTDPDTVITPIAAAPSISIDKTASAINDLDGNGPDAGDTIVYGFVVTNTGNRTLDPVTVTDTLLGTITCPAGPLAPGASRTCTSKTYVITQDDVEAGSVGSPATATGTTAGGTRVTASDSTATPIAAGPRVELDKSSGAVDDVDGNGVDVGDQVTYTFTVTNTGTVNLGSVQVSDPKVGAITCPTTTLAPGRSLSCSPQAYTLTQADVDAGKVVNTATVRATTGGGTGGQVVTGTDTDTVALAERPVIRVDLAAGPIRDVDGNGPDAGDTIDYTTTVTNTGNVTLTGVTVTSPVLGTVTCPRTTLAPGASMVCTKVTHTITAPEAAAGSVEATVTATGTSPRGTSVSDDDSARTPVPVQVTNVSIDKTVDRPSAAPGDSVRYTLTASNDGPATARSVVVSDRLPAGVRLLSAPEPCTSTGNDVSCALGDLAPGATRSVVVTAEVLPPVTGAALVQHDLDIQKVEAQIDLEAGQTRTVTAQCAPGYLVTDGSGRTDAVDQGTGTLGSVRVVRSSASDDRTWTVTAVNDATGRAQAKVFAVCVASSTEQAGAGTSVGAHAHPLVVSAPVTRTVPVAVGRTQVALTCSAGSVPIVPGYVLDATAPGATVLTSYPSAGGWTYAVDAPSAGGTATFSQRCLESTTGEAGGHSHQLDLSEVRQDVTVPAGQVVEVQLTCADDAKGVVAGFDLDPGLVNLGNDPRPKTRAFKLLNPTDAPLHADLYLLCLATRSLAGDDSGVVTNTATVATSTSETSAADNSDKASFTLEAEAAPAPRPVAKAGSTTVTVAARSVTSVIRCGAGTGTCTGTALLVAARTTDVGRTTVRKGTVLARATYRVVAGRTVKVRLVSTGSGLRVLQARSLTRATLRVGPSSSTVTLKR